LGLDFGGFERGEDVVNGLGPDEGVGVGVGVDGVDVDVGWDAGFEVGRGAMDTTPDLFIGEGAEKSPPALRCHHILQLAGWYPAFQQFPDITLPPVCGSLK
jgi:hypothetical protein